MSLVNNTFRVFNRDIIFTLEKLFAGGVVARVLGPAGVGVWAILDLINNYARVFGAPRFEIASVHFMPKKEYAKGDIILITNIIAAFASMFIIIILGILGGMKLNSYFGFEKPFITAIAALLSVILSMIYAFRQVTKK